MRVKGRIERRRDRFDRVYLKQMNQLLNNMRKQMHIFLFILKSSKQKVYVIVYDGKMKTYNSTDIKKKLEEHLLKILNEALEQSNVKRGFKNSTTRVGSIKFNYLERNDIDSDLSVYYIHLTHETIPNEFISIMQSN
jgi:hypothetical protein